MGEWNITHGAPGTDVLPEREDKCTIIAVPTTLLGINTPFNLEVRPSVGAAFGLKWSTSSKIDKVNLLYELLIIYIVMHILQQLLYM